MPYKLEQLPGTLPGKKATETLKLSIIGVPTNSSGKRGGVANAPAALRRAGIVEALGLIVNIQDEGDVTFSVPSTSTRELESGIIALDSLVSMIRGLKSTVKSVLDNSRFPLVIGGDCPVLLGCLGACNEAREHTGLLFVDGHEDAYQPGQSPTGEAADMELGLALGIEVPKKIQEVVGSIPLIDTSKICVLGARDKKLLEKEEVRSLDGMVEFYSDIDLRKSNIVSLTNGAVKRLGSETGRLWLHLDLDVLTTRSLPAVDYQQSGGLSWTQLEQLTKTALSSGKVVGCDVTIYNPDFDPSGRHARRIVKFLENVIAPVD